MSVSDPEKKIEWGADSEPWKNERVPSSAIAPLTKKIYRLKEDQAFSLSLELGQREKAARHPSADFLPLPPTCPPICYEGVVRILEILLLRWKCLRKGWYIIDFMKALSLEDNPWGNLKLVHELFSMYFTYRLAVYIT
jgi:hypothetical protein